jgi:hypothetical protein
VAQPSEDVGAIDAASSPLHLGELLFGPILPGCLS